MSGLIRGLTLRHPWAFCIARLGKDVENRIWHPGRQGGHEGMFLAIHGGAVPKGEALDEFKRDTDWVSEELVNAGRLKGRLDDEQRAWWHQQTITYGTFISPGIVAVARLAGVVRDSKSPWAAAGQYHWQLADVYTLPESIPHKGAQGLWTVEQAALEQLRAQYRARSA